MRPWTTVEGPPGHRKARSDSLDLDSELQDMGVLSSRAAVSGRRESSVTLSGKRLEEKRLRKGRRLELMLEGTWGDREYIGLGAIQVLVGAELEPLVLGPDQIDCSPARDLRALGYEEDKRVLENLLKPRWGADPVGVGREDPGWLLPLAVASRPLITLDLGSVQSVAGLAVWNYNRADEDDTLRGVRTLHVFLDRQPLESFALRKGPAALGLDHVQLLFFGEGSDLEKGNVMPPPAKGGYITYVTPSVRQDYETPLHPTGLLLKLTLHTSWGDPYYMGLDGLQLLGPGGKELAIDPDRVQAWPASLTVLGQTDDCRVPSNLVDGVLASPDATHAWLAPFAITMPPAAAQRLGNVRGAENVLLVLFDRPVSLTALRLWNYRKTPARGVREMSIYLDGRLLFKGGLRRAPELTEEASGYAGQTILFTNDQAVVRKEKDCVAYCGGEEQDVLCIDERQVRVRSRFTSQDPDPSADGVTIDPSKRPGTAVVSAGGGRGRGPRGSLKGV